MLIDLSPWGKRNPLEDKLKLIKQAIGQLHLIRFTYVNVKGESSTRTVEPYTLIMKGQQWYLYAYCSMRSGFRMFKLNRIKELTVTNSVYLRRPLPEEPLPWDHDWYREENLARLQLRIFRLPDSLLRNPSGWTSFIRKRIRIVGWLRYPFLRIIGCTVHIKLRRACGSHLPSPYPANYSG